MTLINSVDPVRDQEFSIGNSQTIIVDSGTSFLLMPYREREKLFDYVTRTLGFSCRSNVIIACYSFNSDDIDYFPDLVFTINQKSYFIPKEDYVIKSGIVIQLGIMSHPTMKIWILGLNFFENYYTIFD